jgi:hypothetical protein
MAVYGASWLTAMAGRGLDWRCGDAFGQIAPIAAVCGLESRPEK